MLSEKTNVTGVKKNFLNLTLDKGHFITEEKYFEDTFKRYFPNNNLSSLGKYKIQILSDEDSNFPNNIASRLLENSHEETRNYLSHIFSIYSIKPMSYDQIFHKCRINKGRYVCRFASKTIKQVLLYKSTIK